MDSLQLLNGISPERQRFVFGRESAPHKIGPRRAAQLDAQGYRVKKSSKDALTISFFGSSVNKKPRNHVRLCREQTQHLHVHGQENAFQRDPDRLGQPLQTIRNFRRDLSLNPHHFSSVGVRSREWTARKTARFSTGESRGPIAPALLGL